MLGIAAAQVVPPFDAEHARFRADDGLSAGSVRVIARLFSGSALPLTADVVNVQRSSDYITVSILDRNGVLVAFDTVRSSSVENALMPADLPHKISLPMEEARSVAVAYDAWKKSAFGLRDDPPAHALGFGEFFVVAHPGKLDTGRYVEFVSFVPTTDRLNPRQIGCDPIRVYVVDPSSFRIDPFPLPC